MPNPALRRRRCRDSYNVARSFEALGERVWHRPRRLSHIAASASLAEARSAQSALLLYVSTAVPRLSEISSRARWPGRSKSAAGTELPRRPPRAAVRSEAVAGSVLIAGGLAGLALLPGAELVWTLSPQVLIGLGLGLSVDSLTAAALRERIPRALHGGWTISARHAQRSASEHRQRAAGLGPARARAWVPRQSARRPVRREASVPLADQRAAGVEARERRS